MSDLARGVPLEQLLALAHDEHGGGERGEEQQVAEREALRLSGSPQTFVVSKNVHTVLIDENWKVFCTNKISV